MEQTFKLDGETFTVRRGKGECTLEVVNGGDVGEVEAREAGAFDVRFAGTSTGSRTPGHTAEAVSQALSSALHLSAQLILESRKPKPAPDAACEAMGRYLQDGQ